LTLTQVTLNARHYNQDQFQEELFFKEEPSHF